MSTIDKTSDRLDDAAETMLRAISVMFLVAVFVAVTCAVVLIVAFTFAVLHNGNDFTFDGGSAGDLIVLPSLLR